MGFLRQYVFSTDHKMIGKQYLMLSIFSVVIGTVLSILMRVHLVYPDAKIRLLAMLWPTSASGGVMTPEL